MTKYRLENVITKEIVEWTVARILEEINRDRSGEWTDYDKSDWQEGLEEFTEYKLIQEGK